ncbi:unnamed protein product [Owenia fusiformis]|uniref:SCP domain-containing protein n=1 Tax=Owenia fusiformis TaxID=6347 RepID=A0A8S4N2G3_OWEFU|nr:unnamed protein product [Owenia fusiformis]
MGNGVPASADKEEAVDKVFVAAHQVVHDASDMSDREKRSTCNVIADNLPTDGWQQYMVEAHNERRFNEAVTFGISDENKLTYNQELAMMAQFRANKCIWDHGDYIDCNGNVVGQNMYYVSGSEYHPIDNEITDRALVGWYENEKPHYDPSSTSCAEGKVCGHYTQVIWAATERMGCGARMCETLYGGDGVTVYRNSKHTLVVCNYSPPGNYVDMPPFSQGPFCSKCKGDTGYSCSNGVLCTKCDHRIDVDCVNCNSKQGDVLDESSCTFWKGSGFCAAESVYSAFMQQNCKDTCACP